MTATTHEMAAEPKASELPPGLESEKSASTATPDQKPAAPAVLLTMDPHTSYAAFANIREKGPVVRVGFDVPPPPKGTPQESGFRDFLSRDNFFVAHYDEVLEALLEDRISVDPRVAMTPEQYQKMPPVPEEFRPISRTLLSVDAPDHTRLRKLVQPSFTPRAMEGLRERVQKIAENLLDKAEQEAAERGESAPNRRMDLIEAFAYPLPVTVISDMLGIPVEDREKTRLWTENLLQVDARRGQVMSEEGRAKLREFTAYLRRLFEVKRKSPAEDMISQLIRAEEDGDRLDEEELLSMVFILYLAGHVTTVNLVGNGIFALLSHPGEREKLKADPGLARGMVEETLRFWGPVDFIARRFAKEDFELGGTHIARGESLVVGLASANRDPGRFSKPDTFDITRPDADKHVAFGKGIHICVGAPLARMEGQIAFETLIRRFPELRLAVPAEEVRWSNSFLRGFSKLPLFF